MEPADLNWSHKLGLAPFPPPFLVQRRRKRRREEALSFENVASFCKSVMLKLVS